MFVVALGNSMLPFIISLKTRSSLIIIYLKDKANTSKAIMAIP